MTLRILPTFFLAAGLVMAQRGGGGKKGGGGGDMPMAPAARPEPLDQLAQILKLNKDQKKDIKGIMDEAQKEATPLRDEMAKGREQVAEAIEAGKSQDEIDKAVKAFSVQEAQMARIEANAFNKILAGLDSDQKANSQALVGTFMFMNGIFRRKNWNSNPSE